jgi:hypothetical protein
MTRRAGGRSLYRAARWPISASLPYSRERGRRSSEAPSRRCSHSCKVKATQEMRRPRLAPARTPG